MKFVFRKTIVALVAGSFLALAAGPSSAASSGNSGAAAACPSPGWRVKAGNSAKVYVVDPNGELLHIPDPTVYFNLWDSWDGILTIDSSLLDSCWPKKWSIGNSRLARRSGDDQIFIWDGSAGGYRWIIDAWVFEHKYGFSWSKVRTVEAITPVESAPEWF
ncbi:hypothetical protein ACFS5L_40945 [Streptomyces phyllanthi]|uniref:Uncharacterized protein n=1 Tax=Streptomyces phyllanthi TaxID=1803180 RepID=A0A5N8W7C6_9ACTN|nr:hypothetical protein [Streptomyces phyllanthi]MPY43012.1 hypothetical protein [Streptomyces phyllanthi]